MTLSMALVMMNKLKSAQKIQAERWRSYCGSTTNENFRNWMVSVEKVASILDGIHVVTRDAGEALRDWPRKYEDKHKEDK